jgi:hypothetical protein
VAAIIFSHSTNVMKKFFSPLTTSIICLSLFAMSCKKDNGSNNPPGPGPGVTLATSGFLCTMGINRDGHTDTLTYWFSTSGQEMTGYGPGYQRPEDEIRLLSNGNGTTTIRRKTPYVYNNKSYDMFGIEVNASPAFSSFPDNKYLFDFFNEAPSVETEFIIKRTDADANKFTIESKAYPSYFLGTAKWKNATYPTETRLVFTGKQQVFFFMQQ